MRESNLIQAERLRGGERGQEWDKESEKGVRGR